MIETRCPHCGTAYRLKPELAGRTVRCRACQDSFEVPVPDDDDGDDEDMGLQTVETAPIRNFSPASRSRRPSQRPKARTDDLGFLTDFDDHQDHENPQFDDHEDDADHDFQMMQAAARRGAEALYEPRQPVFRSGRKPRTTPLIPKEVFAVFGGLVVGGILLFFAIHFLSNMSFRAAVSGLPAEIAAEFEQDDPALGSPAPESVKQFKTLQVRDLSKHKQLMRDMTAAMNESADIMSRIQDQQSSQANAAELQRMQTKVMDLQSQAMKLFNPNPKEDREIARAIGDNLMKSIERMSREARRIASLSNDPFASMKLGTMERAFATVKAKYGGDVEAADDPEAYVEVRVAGLKSKDEREYIYEQLRELASPKTSRTKTDSMSATRYALWPVKKASLFAKKITFGKVIRTTGKEVWVVVDSLDPQTVKEWVAAKAEAQEKAREDRERTLAESRARSEAAKAGGGSSGPGEPEIPANADDVTKGLILATKSQSIFKKRDGVKLLKTADLKGREDEVLGEMKVLMDDSDIFTVRDVLEVIKRCESPKRLEILVERLSKEQYRDDVVKALGELKDPDAIPAMVEAMRFDTWRTIDKHLIAFGEPAESYVIQQLGSGDADIRRRACDILAEIGTQESLKAFRKLPADPSFSVRNAANNAMRAIQNRSRLAVDKEKS